MGWCLFVEGDVRQELKLRRARRCRHLLASCSAGPLNSSADFAPGRGPADVPQLETLERDRPDGRSHIQPLGEPQT